MNITEILQEYPYVFQNEFNNRKVLYSTDELVSNFSDFKFCSFNATLLVTEDKDGKLEVFQFFSINGKRCYSGITEHCNLYKKVMLKYNISNSIRR